MFLLKPNAAKLAGLPVQKLPDIMTVFEQRKKIPPWRWLPGATGRAGNILSSIDMIIVAEYVLIEKIPGVLGQGYGGGALSLLHRKTGDYRQPGAEGPG